MTTLRTLALTALLLCPISAWAADSCPSAEARACISARVFKDASSIQDPMSRDQTLRGLAASLTYDGQIDEAIAMLSQIANPTTQAMTVRAISMAAALSGKNIVFEKLKSAVEKITQPEAAILAQTFIAAAEASNDPNSDIAKNFKDPALKNEALSEITEIQAERGDMDRVMKTASQIDDVFYRDASYQTAATILIRKNMIDAALKVAEAIDDPAKRAQTMLLILKNQEEKKRTGTAAAATAMPEKIIP